MGVVVGALLGARDVDELEELDRPLLRLRLIQLEVQLEGLGDLAADREDRVEARHRVLEDHRDVVPADGPNVVVVHLEDVHAVEDDGALDDLARGLRDEPHERERGHRLATAGLAHDAEGLAGGELERHAVDRVHHTVAGEELRLEVFDLE